VQVRGLQKLGPPLKMIAPGRVFRNEEVDASHEHTFYQVEGMMVDRDVSGRAHGVFHEDHADRDLSPGGHPYVLRPGFFPFVEPVSSWIFAA
jgi:phenylalanyl-tRNA synthetase alpha chain